MDADFFKKMQPRFLTPEEVEQREETPPSPEVANEAHKHDIDDPYPSVPSELKALRQWVMWKAEVRNGKPTKIPKQVTVKNAKTDTPATWTDYQAVCEALRTGRFDGIGFVFTEEDKYTGIDLDDCIIDGVVQPWAKEIIGKFQSSAYMEVSPSGNGIKIWTRAKLPPDAKNKTYLRGNTGSAIEAYDSVRYFTGNGNGKYAIGDGQATCNWLVEKYLKKATPAPASALPPVNNTRSTTEIKQLIDNSRQRGKYHALMQGNWQSQGYGSHSEADLGLISLLCFWTQDTRHLDAIFRQSQLYREKWDEKHRSDGATYGEMTIEAALSQSRETYTPPKPKTQRRRRETFYEKRAKRRRYR